MRECFTQGQHVDTNILPMLYFDHKIHDSLVTMLVEDMFLPEAYPSRFPANIVAELLSGDN